MCYIHALQTVSGRSRQQEFWTYQQPGDKPKAAAHKAEIHRSLPLAACITGGQAAPIPDRAAVQRFNVADEKSIDDDPGKRHDKICWVVDIGPSPR